MKRLVGLALLVTVATPAQAAETWATVGPWSIARTDTACVALYRANKDILALVRRVDGASLVEYKNDALGQDFAGEIILRRSGAPLVRLPLALDPVDSELAAPLTSEQWLAVARADSFAVTGAKRRTVAQGETPEFSAMMRKLTRCSREQAAVDRGSGKPAATPPGLLALGMTADDYPDAALRQEAQGRVISIVTVSAKGRVSGCRVKESSGFPLLDEAACDVISRRARFRAGRDADGQPTEAVALQPITWQIPQ